jgi:hypothetical protein
MSQTLEVQVTTPRRIRQARLAGAAAGPLYIIVGTLEALLRDGFDIRIHSLSLLANGTGGWIHSTMMVASGLLTVVGALGLSGMQRTGRRSYAMIIGLVVYGLGIAAAGLLRADPAGVSIGTPAGPPVVVTGSGKPPGCRGNWLPRADRCMSCLRTQVRTGWRSCLGRLLGGDRRLLSRCLRRHRFGSRQPLDQHCLHSCGRAGLGMDHGPVCPRAQRNGVATLLPSIEIAELSESQHHIWC